MNATTISRKAPGRSHRKGISLLDLRDMFPDEESARVWVESQMWGESNRFCGHCGSDNNHEVDHRSMPYRCRDCRKYFSVKTGTVLASAKVSLLQWIYATYMEITNLKGVSSMKLHRDLGVTQKTAWYMLQRIREAFKDQQLEPYIGPVEVDEAYFGGKAKNMHYSKRSQLTGRGGADKSAVVGLKDRATGKVTAMVVERTDAATLVPFVEDATTPDATVYSDGNQVYRKIDRDHEYVEHSVGEYVRDMAHVNGIESFWSMLKRGIEGVYHHLSAKHLHRYVNGYAGKHNFRDLDTIDQMAAVIQGMMGKRLHYRDLIADTGTG